MDNQSIQPKLNDTALQFVKNSLVVKSKLQLVLNRCPRTLDRYIAANNPKLADSRALQVISKETGIPQRELLQSA